MCALNAECRRCILDYSCAFLGVIRKAFAEFLSIATAQDKSLLSFCDGFLNYLANF